MIVVADTSPLSYLALIGQLDLLPTIFEKVLIPPAVLRELEHESAPVEVRSLLSLPPSWLQLQGYSPSDLGRVGNSLGAGEREAINLALQEHVRIVLMDEARGRQIARSLCLEVVGTLGILEQGAKLEVIDLRNTLDKLGRTNFRLSAGLRSAALQRNWRLKKT